MSAVSRYLIALMPPAGVAERVDVLRQEVYKTYGCQKALKHPVHVTLYPPFEATAEDEKMLQRLHEWVKGHQPIQVEIKDFGFFPKNRNPVLFADVADNPALRGFNKALTAEVKRLLPKNDARGTERFHPHFTLAYRDTNRQMFSAMQEEYSQQTFSASFLMNSIFLWRHNRKNWDVIDEYLLGNGA